MSTNSDLAEILRGIADLLDLQGERFKPEAYRRAARSIESLPEDIRQMSARGELRTIPGVGDAIAEKVREFLKDGRIPYYDRLAQEVPAGVRELMRLPGVGPKTARRFLVEFGIQGPAELAAAIEAGRFRGATGFKERKIEQLRLAVAAGTPSGARTPLFEAWKIAETLIAALRAKAPVEQIVAAGSLRRRRETVGDLDILVTSSQPEAVFDAFSALPSVAEIRLRGPTKETVLVQGGLQVDLRVVDPASFGAALQYFTGSKEHNVILRTRARDQGLKINEYGVVRGEERVAGATEEDVYASVGLRYIPPEIRESRGEIEASEKGHLPTLVDAPDVRGELHVHLAADSGPGEVDRIRQEALQQRWAYVGFIGSTPTGEPPAPALDRIEHWRRAPNPEVRVLLGAELKWDDPAPPTGPDYCIATLEGAANPPKPLSKGRPRPEFAGHLRLAAPGQEGAPEGLPAWVKWSTTSQIPLEVSPRGATDGLDSYGVRLAMAAELSLHLTAGIASADGHLSDLTVALGLARRGWATPDRILNRSPPRGT